MRLVGVMKMWNRQVPYVWLLRIRRNILAAEVPPEEQRVPAPHWTPQAGASVPGRGVSMTFGCENQWGFHPRKTDSCWKLRCTN